MAGDSKIQWTQKTWNPVAGCSVLSPGCTNCYAMKQAYRIEAMAKGSGRTSAYDGLTRQTKAGPVWTGELRLVESALTQPLRWRQPAVIFVNSMSDLFHEALPDAAIDQVFAVMALAPQHTFQVLTKRAERMRAYVSDPDTPARIIAAALRMKELPRNWQWPLPNVWKGVSAEDQPRADERTPHLLATPAAVRFVSAEPLLGAIDLTRVGSLDIIRSVHPGMVGWIEQDLRPEPIGGMTMDALTGAYVYQTPNHMGGCAAQGQSPHLDWVIAGGESGPGARPMHPDWARQLRNQCAAAGVPFFFKQWGAWTPGENVNAANPNFGAYYDEDAGRWDFTVFSPAAIDGLHIDDEPDVWSVGKKAAGRLLDGVEHNALPEARA